MGRYKTLVCREYWGYVEVEAENENEAIKKVENYDYDSEFQSFKIGEQSVYSAQRIE